MLFMHDEKDKTYFNCFKGSFYANLFFFESIIYLKQMIVKLLYRFAMHFTAIKKQIKIDFKACNFDNSLFIIFLNIY